MEEEKYRIKRYRKQRGKGFPIGLLASAAVPILGEVAKSILKKKGSVVEEKEDETKNSTWKTSCPSDNKLAQRYIFRGKRQKISRKNLLGNIRVWKTRAISARNKGKTKKKKVRFALANTPAQDRARRIKKNYRKLRRAQTGKGLNGNLQNLGICMGSKAINSVLGKKIIDNGIENIPNLFRYGASKIKNKNVNWALNSDIANYGLEETQNKAKNKLTNLFGGV